MVVISTEAAAQDASGESVNDSTPSHELRIVALRFEAQGNDAAAMHDIHVIGIELCVAGVERGYERVAEDRLTIDGRCEITGEATHRIPAIWKG